MNNALKQSFMVLFILTILCVTVMSVSATDLTNDSQLLTNSNDVNLLQNTVSVNGENFSDIQTVIDNAKDGDTIYLNNHTFKGNGTEIIVNKSITIDGSHEGVNGETSTLDADYLSRVFNIKSSNVILQNLILTHGNTTSKGGAGHWDGANGTMTNVEVYDSVSQEGGAFRFTGENMTIDSCKFHNCNSTGDGGGIDLIGVNQTVINCEIYNNKAYRAGGGIETERDNIKIINSSIYNNTASTNNGAGIIIAGTNNLIDNCKIFNNTNYCIPYSGGGVAVGKTNCTIRNSNFYNNTGVFGSAIFVFSTYCTIDNCTCYENYANNTASGNKQQIYGATVSFNNNGNYGKVINCIVENNTAYSNQTIAGFVLSGGSNFILNNTRVCNNFANCTGENKSCFTSIYVHGNNSIIDNVLIYNNTAIGDTTARVGRIICDNATFINSIVDNNKVYGNRSASGFVLQDPMGVAYNNIFSNNHIYATNVSLGGGCQLFGTAYNCTFINNTCVSELSNSHAGAICFRPNALVYNCTFINNIADYGGATTFHSNGTLSNCTFINNTARLYGGAISTGLDTETQTVNITNSYFEGNSAQTGGAFYGKGDSIQLLNSTFKDNSATGGANYTSEGGAFYIEGNNITIGNCNLTFNNARYGGAGYIEGSDAKILKNDIRNNTADIYGGAIFITGSNSLVDNNTFISNSAIPNNTLSDDGLGGAIYVKGDNTTTLNSIFYLNTARNGSAIYTDGVNCHINSTVFDQNQAWAYVIGLNGNPAYSYYPSNVTVSGTLIGGNNIANAIYNTAKVSDIYFDNVTYVVYINDTYVVRTTNSNETHPVLGAANSKNGSILYQDVRENNQLINLTIIDNHGNVVYKNTTIYSGVYGNFDEIFNSLSPGKYYVYSNHVEDNYYKGIQNTTSFVIDSNITANKTVNKTHSYSQETISWLITVCNNDNVTAKGVNVSDVLSKDLVYLGSSASQGFYDNDTGVWIIGDMKPNSVVTLKINTLVNVSNATIFNGFKVNYENLFHDVSGGDTTYVSIITDISTTKTVNDSNPNYMDVISWTITASNVWGPDNASNVKISDLLPDGLTYINSTASRGSYNSTSGVWTIGDLGVGETVTLTLDTQVTKSNVNITNFVNLTCTEKDWNMTNNYANASITVPSSIDLAVIKIVNNTNPNYLDTVSWIISIINYGPDNASNVKVSDILPKGLTYLNSNASLGTYDFNTGVWTVGNLSVNETQSLTINTLVNTSNVNLTNFVNVTGKEFDWNMSNNYANANISVNDTNSTPGNDTPIHPVNPNHPNSVNPNIKGDNGLTATGSGNDSLASNGVGMKSTGNPILVLLMVLLILGGIIPYRKQK